MMSQPQGGPPLYPQQPVYQPPQSGYQPLTDQPQGETPQTGQPPQAGQPHGQAPQTGHQQVAPMTGIQQPYHYPQMTPVPGQPIIVAAPPVNQNQPQQNTGPRSSKAHQVLGWLQITSGIVLFIANCVLIGEFKGDGNKNPAIIGVGIWGGAMFILAGAFGVHGGKTLNKCPLITTMVLSICSIIPALTAIIVASVGVSFFDYYRFAVDNREYRSYNYRYRGYNLTSVKFFYSVFLIFSLIEFVVAIIQPAFGCYYVCKCQDCCLPVPPAQPVTVYVSAPGQPAGQYMQAQPAGQYMQAQPAGQYMQAQPVGQYIQAQPAGQYVQVQQAPGQFNQGQMVGAQAGYQPPPYGPPAYSENIPEKQ